MHHGFFIANQPKSQYIRSSQASFAELAITTATDGSKAWQADSHFPKLGMGLLYGDPGSRKYLGKLSAMYPFIDFPFVQYKRLFANFRLGFGPGWVEKPYDKQDNYKNLVISTHLNACIRLALEAELRLTRKIAVQGGASFTHLSNGSIRVPNLGLNIPTGFVGINYQLQPEAILHLPRHPSGSGSWANYLYVLGALKQSYPLESATYFVYIINLERLRQFSGNGKYGGGINISYDRSLSKEVGFAPTYLFDKSDVQLQGSLYGCYEYVMGRLSIPVQAGVYIYNKYRLNAVYQNVGLRYKFSHQMIACLQLKTHLGKADYIQWGIGVKF